MKILAIESSAVTASVALAEDERLVYESFANNGLTHSATLMPMVENALAAAGWDIGQVDLVGVPAGPGSFTGLRIGMATAKGLAQARKIRCAGVSTLEAIAQNLLGFEGTACAVMDARCSQVYCALFDVSGGDVRRLMPDRAVSLEELEDEVRRCEGRVFLAGDGARLCHSFLGGRMKNISLAPEGLVYQRASSVARVALRLFREGYTVSPGALSPVYLRLPQAERELEKKKGGALG